MRGRKGARERERQREEKNVHLQAKVVVEESLKVTEEGKRSEGSAHYSLLPCTTRVRVMSVSLAASHLSAYIARIQIG